jgi:hypothetical protein
LLLLRYLPGRKRKGQATWIGLGSRRPMSMLEMQGFIHFLALAALLE